MRRRRELQGGRRRGVAIVELAIALPLLVAIVVFTMEISSVLYAMQTLQATAHECSRLASKRTATNATVQSMGVQMLTQRGIRNGRVRTVPSNIEGLARGTQIRVVVTAPFSQNSWLPRTFFKQNRFIGRATVVKQF